MSLVQVENAEGVLEDYELRSFSWTLNEETGVAVATFNSPKNMNSLTQNLRWELFVILEHAARDEDVRVLVWTGEGRAFCAGADLAGSSEVHLPRHLMKAMHARNFSPGADLVLMKETLAFWDFPKVSIAAVNGLAVGGGANIALFWHDMVVCSTAARFKYPFAQLGLTPELGSSKLMPLHVGLARTKEIMFVGGWFDAARALELGLCNRVVEPGELLGAALALAEKVAEQNGEAIRLSKQVLNHHFRVQLEQVLQEEQDVIVQSVKIHHGDIKKLMGGGVSKL
jgi:enoyl-CoA hydratase/carnithine racemase